MRVAGVTIPEKKHLSTALTSIYGIGVSRARKMLEEHKIPVTTYAEALTPEQETSLRKSIGSFQIEGDLRREVSRNIKHYKDVNCVRGLRHSAGLPVRGQRTSTNARTRKGPKKTMGSGRTKLQKK